MQNVGIPQPPVVVTILWQRNPLNPTGRRTVVQASVIGTLNRCQRFLRSGSLLSDANSCLLQNGFQRISSNKFGVFGVSTYINQNQMC